jgi:RNA polymerase sigma-70 factor (ECF subfamily)
VKIIPLFKDEPRLILRASKSDRVAQRCLYEKYAPKMLALCRGYVKDLQFAEDVMHKGFLKVFMHLQSFTERGSFEGWVRRIMVNESINFLKQKRLLVFESDINELEIEKSPEVSVKSDAEYLLRIIDQLPHEYRIVFMLYAIEGYTHKEIALAFNISEATSRSKLSKARKLLQKKLKLTQKKYETL